MSAFFYLNINQFNMPPKKSVRKLLVNNVTNLWSEVKVYNFYYWRVYPYIPYINKGKNFGFKEYRYMSVTI